MVLKWGIVGAGKISHDFAVALSILDPKLHTIVAIAARSIESAQKFADTHNIGKAYGEYKNLADDTEVDIVYIGVINTAHKEVSQMMLLKNKHVLCEKPMCMNLADTVELIKIAREKKCFLMEAMWSRFFPVYKELKAQLDNGAVGVVKRIEACLGFNISEVERIRSRKLGGGAMLDLGVYLLQFVKFVYGDVNPSVVHALGKLNDEGVDEHVSITLQFPDGKTASLSTYTTLDMNNTAEIMGTEGYISIPDFWCPTEIYGPNVSKCFDLPPTDKHLNFKNSNGLVYEIEEVRHCIEKGLLESPNFSHDESISLASWRDQILRTIKVSYNRDG